MTAYDLVFKKMTPNEAKQAFKKVSTYDEFTELMVGVVENIIPSPLYDFKPVDEVNTDNSWWKPASKRWQIIYNLTKHGFITLNAQECDESLFESRNDYHKRSKIGYWNCRASLNFMFPKSQDFKTFKTNMKNLGYLCFEGKIGMFENKNPKLTIPLTIVTYLDGHEEITTSIKLWKDSKTFTFFDDIVPHLNSTFLEWINDHCTFCIIIDPCYNRPAHYKDGVFTVAEKLLINE